MKTEVIVFDFDKTLTVKDTIFGFYRSVSGNGATFSVKRILFLAGAVLFKAKLFSNDSLKRLGAALFLHGYTEKELKAKGVEYASGIEMNGVFEGQFRQYPAEPDHNSVSFVRGVPEAAFSGILGGRYSDPV
jgi:hypothetical protein